MAALKQAALLAALFMPLVVAAQGPPCWDKVPPNEKYARRHIINGSPSGETLSADGLVVSAKLVDGDSYLNVEVSITNCSGVPVTVDPRTFSLVIQAPQGDVKLASLDPAHYVRFPKTGKTYPSLVPENLAYGRIGTYQLFFERDGRAQPIDKMHSNYTLGLSVLVDRWQFSFEFPRKKG